MSKTTTRKLPDPKVAQPIENPSNRGGALRGARLPLEDAVAADYVRRLLESGRRKNESYLAFRKRLALVITARRLWVRAWLDLNGAQVEIAARMGIHRGTVPGELKRVGLDKPLLDRMLAQCKSGDTGLQRQICEGIPDGMDPHQGKGAG